MKRSMFCVVLASAATLTLAGVARAVPYASGISVSGTTVTFVLNESADNVTVNRTPGTPLNLGALPKGSHSFDTGGATSWEIVVTKNAPLNWVQISNDTDNTSKYYYPTGVAVNKNPASPYFGWIYVAEGWGGTTASPQRTTQDGLYVMKADQSDAIGQGDTAMTGGVTWATGLNRSPGRLAIDDDGNVFITDWSDSHSGIWIAPPDLSGTFTELFSGYDTRATSGLLSLGGASYAGSVAGAWLEGSGASRKLYTVDEDYPDIGDINRYDIGTANSGWTTAPAKQTLDGDNRILNSLMDLARHPDGSWFVAQYRSGLNDVDGAPSLAHWQDGANAADWHSGPGSKNLQLYSGYGDIDVIQVGSVVRLALGARNHAGGQCIYVLDVTDSANPMKEFTIPYPGTVQDVCFDIVGNIYAVNNITETLRIFSRGGNTVAKTRSDGTFEYTPDNSPLVPAAPVLNPVLVQGGNTMNISNIAGDTTKIRFYKNGAATPEYEDTAAPFPVTYTASLPFTLDAGDYWEVTLTNLAGESSRSNRRCVVPDPLAIPAPYPNATEDFEAASLDPCWIHWTPNYVLATAPDPSHGQSAKSAATGAGELGTDLKPTDPLDSAPILFSFWMYHSVNDPTTETNNHFAQISSWSGDGHRVGSVQQLFGIGMFDISQTLANGWYRVKYHARNYPAGVTGTAPFDGYGEYTAGKWTQLADGPDRSTGWHKFTIKLGSAKVVYYVDGIRGLAPQDATPTSIDSFYLDNGATSNSSPGMDAYYDDVTVSIGSNVEPVLTLTNIDAQEGTAITPTDQVGSDPDDPDTVELTIQGTLPDGLTASATSVSGNPAIITISGTPAPGTAAGSPYYVSFSVKDELGLEVVDDLIITITTCPSPRQDADGDGDVDVNDFATFQACFNGAGNPYPALPPDILKKCACLDSEPDGDVDVNDFAEFQVCFNGAGNPPSPSCGS